MVMEVLWCYQKIVMKFAWEGEVRKNLPVPTEMKHNFCMPVYL